MIEKFSELLSARPPAITIDADDNSGRSDWITSSVFQTALAASKPEPGAAETAAELPVSAAASNEVVRTVIT